MFLITSDMSGLCCTHYKAFYVDITSLGNFVVQLMLKKSGIFS